MWAHRWRRRGVRTEQHEAFLSFVEHASPRLLTLAWMLSGDAHAAEDLVQETLERVYVKWRRIADRNPTAYARTVLTNLHTDRWRRRRREVLVDEAPDAAGAERESHVVDLVRALQQLPARERQIVVLRYYADQSELQVAQTLGVSLGTVKSSGSRGLGRLRVLLGEGDGDRAGV